MPSLSSCVAVVVVVVMTGSSNSMTLFSAQEIKPPAVIERERTNFQNVSVFGCLSVCPPCLYVYVYSVWRRRKKDGCYSSSGCENPQKTAKMKAQQLRSEGSPQKYLPRRQQRERQSPAHRQNHQAPYIGVCVGLLPNSTKKPSGLVVCCLSKKINAPASRVWRIRRPPPTFALRD